MAEARKRKLPRWTVLVLWPLLFLLSHVGAPAALAERGRRVGWRQGRPGGWNLLGLGLVVLGAAGLGWCVWLHYTRSPRRVVAGAPAPTYLLREGPYRWSRNPMYVAGMAMWAGWALFYGSRRGAASALVYWSGVALLAVPYEERHLTARFGERYARYRRAIPRWLPVPRWAHRG